MCSSFCLLWRLIHSVSAHNLQLSNKLTRGWFLRKTFTHDQKRPEVEAEQPYSWQQSAWPHQVPHSHFPGGGGKTKRLNCSFSAQHTSWKSTTLHLESLALSLFPNINRSITALIFSHSAGRHCKWQRFPTLQNSTLFIAFSFFLFWRKRATLLNGCGTRLTTSRSYRLLDLRHRSSGMVSDILRMLPSLWGGWEVSQQLGVVGARSERGAPIS